MSHKTRDMDKSKGQQQQLHKKEPLVVDMDEEEGWPSVVPDHKATTQHLLSFGAKYAGEDDTEAPPIPRTHQQQQHRGRRAADPPAAMLGLVREQQRQQRGPHEEEEEEEEAFMEARTSHMYHSQFSPGAIRVQGIYPLEEDTVLVPTMDNQDSQDELAAAVQPDDNEVPSPIIMAHVVREQPTPQERQQQAPPTPEQPPEHTESPDAPAASSSGAWFPRPGNRRIVIGVLSVLLVAAIVALVVVIFSSGDNRGDNKDSAVNVTSTAPVTQSPTAVDVPSTAPVTPPPTDINVPSTAPVTPPPTDPCLPPSVAPGELYAVRYSFTNSQVIQIDQTTGIGTLVGDSGVPKLNAAASDSLGRFIAAGEQTLYVIDPSTGVATFLVQAVNPPSGRDIRALAVDADDRVYAVWSTSDVNVIDILTEIDLGTGVLSGHVNMGSLTGVQSLAFDDDCNLFCTNVPNTLHSVDIETGTTVQIGQLSTNDVQGLEYDYYLGIMYLARQDGELFSVNTATGALTAIGAMGFNSIRGLAIVPV